MKTVKLAWVATLIFLALLSFSVVNAAPTEICYDVGVDHSNTTNIQVDGQGSGNYSCSGNMIIEGFDYDDLGDRHINSIRCIDTKNVISSQTQTYVKLTVDGKNSCGSGKILTGVTYVDKDGTQDDYVSHIICKPAGNVSTTEYLVPLAGQPGNYYTKYSDDTNPNVGWAITAVNQNRNPQFNLRGFYAARINFGKAGEGVQQCVQSAICDTGYEPTLKTTKVLDSTKSGTAGPSYRNGFSLPTGNYVLELDQGAWSRWNSDSTDTTRYGGKSGYAWESDVTYRYSVSSTAVRSGELGFKGFYKNASEAEAVNNGYLQPINIGYQTFFGNNIWVYIADTPITDNRNGNPKPTVKIWQCNPIPACRNGIDDDGDGAIDLADFSCSSANDISESLPQAQCQDGIDNDGDGISDAADPGCWTNTSDSTTYNNQDNTENSATTQCQDGTDNDGDGLTDAADPGCWTDITDPTTYDKTLNDESTATSQCQDTTDNDGDGVSDAADPGCWTDITDPTTYDKTLNDESTATTQCQDGTDNDADSLIDANDNGCWTDPTNASTYDATLNNESAATSQCQDGVDNDGDSVSDAADPGCWTDNTNASTYDPTRDDESTSTTQCQDGIDNDGDGVADMSDFSCSAPTDNDETNPMAQCQDGIDNDGDGVVDMMDPGCVDNQDNTENSATTQCQDGLDNDGDGLIDMIDPGCAGPFDNDETNGVPPVPACMDGIDNDGDGAIDFPFDFGCVGPMDNDETNNNPNYQCSNGIDDDGDVLVDQNDPGCIAWNDNNETNIVTVTQCNDGIDNDGDGAVDLADFSCANANDNDETNPMAQCQDGIDNDGDGVTDLADPGCTDNQDNTENSATTQCQDGIDNDGDFATDANDPGCWTDPTNSSTYDRTLNDESLARHLDVTNLTNAPAFPGCTQNIQICADVINNTAPVNSVTLTVSSSSGTANFAMSLSSGNTYCRGNLSAATFNAVDGFTVNYQVFADDTAGNNDTETGGSFTYDCKDPTAVVDGPYTCNEGDTVTFDASNSSDTVDPNLDFAWDLDNDGNYDDGTGDTASFMCIDDGTYSVSVQVLDDSGNNDTADSNATVNNVDPVANANGPYSVNGGYTVALSGTATDAGTADTHTFTWDLDNDSTFEVTGANPVFACAANATYDITLKVVDDDGGSDTDSTTVTCTNVTLPPSGPHCSNGVDDDGDGLIDLADPGCTDANDTDETDPVALAQCQDGLDNDGDGLTDLADPDCSSPTDNDESGTSGPATQCNDGLDNDGDGLTDLADPDCSDINDNTESGTSGLTECSDGIDNDGDGDIDYPADAHCKSKADDRERRNVNTGSGGGGSSSNQCRVEWSCGAWSECNNGIQTRSCVDANQCGTIRGRPATTQVCEMPTETITLGQGNNGETLNLNAAGNGNTLLNPALAINNNKGSILGLPWYLLIILIGIILLILLILIALAARN